MRLQDALALWVEDVRRDSFKVCLRETKIFDGLHKNIKVVSEFLLSPVKCLKVDSHDSQAVPRLLQLTGAGLYQNPVVPGALPLLFAY